MPTTTVALLVTTYYSLESVDILSVRHISKQAWAIRAKSLVRNVALLTMVLIVSRTHPTTFLISISRRLFSDNDIPVLLRPCCQAGKRPSDFPRCPMFFDDRFISDERDFRSCQIKMPVNVKFKVVSKIIIVSAAAGCIPILQIPSTRERAARGAMNWKAIIPA
jgi:hypothetical protein